MEKSCEYCQSVFSKKKRLSYKQFNERKYCSRSCGLMATDKHPDKSIDDRFWKKVNIPEDKTKCWRWTGMTDKFGYGRIKPKDSKLMLAHRFSYELKFGEIPANMMARHICNNPLCVNPEHIRLGKGIDNSDDCNISNRQGHKGTKFDYRLISVLFVALKMGANQKFLSNLCGVSRQTINRINNKQVWTKELDDLEKEYNDLFIKK